MVKIYFSIILFSLNLGAQVVDVNGHVTAALKKPLEVEGVAFDNSSSFASLSKAGVSLGKTLDDHYSVKINFSSKYKVDNHKPFVDIARINYAANSWLEFNFGRLKTPVWMHSEYRDVGILLPWLELPNEVYDNLPLDYIDGAQVVFKKRFFDLVGVDFSIFGGSAKQSVITNRKEWQSRTSITEQSEIYLNLQNLFGGQLLLQSDDVTLNIAYTRGHDRGFLYTDAHANLGAGNQLIRVRTETNLGSSDFLNFGGKYTGHDLLLMGEYVKIGTSGDFYRDFESYYSTFGRYFFEGKFLPHLTYARSTKVSSTQFGGRSISSSIGLNYYATSKIVWKIDFKNVRLIDTPASRLTINPDDRYNVVSFGIETVF